jgi:uncharacterized DUF497 family protein
MADPVRVAARSPYEHMAMSVSLVPAFLSGKGPLRMDARKDQENQRKHGVSFVKAQFAFADPHRMIAEDLSHSSSEKRYYCFGLVEGGVMTVRFTYRDDVIRIFGAGYWRKGKQTYEREHQVHGRTSRTAEGRS